jgi:hypothetical protein
MSRAWAPAVPLITGVIHDKTCKEVYDIVMCHFQHSVALQNYLALGSCAASGEVPHRGINAHQRSVHQPLLLQRFQENRGHSDTPRVGPILLGERLVEGERSVAELWLGLPV